MPKIDPVLTKMREFCLALPDTKETLTWGKPHFRVVDKIFAGYGEDDEGRSVIGFKLHKDHARAVVKSPLFWPSPYVGRHGWVSTDGNTVEDWDGIRAMVNESYELIAPKKSLAKLDADADGGADVNATGKTRKRRK